MANKINIEDGGNERETLPCPFCGNSNIVRFYHRNYAKIGCAKCSVFLELSDKHFSTITETRHYYEDVLVYKWNNRIK